jgi:hypothetical protein
LSFSLAAASSSSSSLTQSDENDGGSANFYTHSDNNAINKYNSSPISSPSQQQQDMFSLSNNNNSSQVLFHHIPTYCDMLIGYPTQRGFIAYRKPEIGSWYMNAIVQLFSKHAHDTDLCAMLNMVNQMISNEVTNTGKKQMSEYTSKLTKPYFYFFPGLASDPIVDETATTKSASSMTHDDNKYNYKKQKQIDQDLQYFSNKKKKMNENYLVENSCLINDQTDSNALNFKQNIVAKSDGQEFEVVEFLAERANSYWKHLAREMNLRECQIVDIDRNRLYSINSDKLKAVLYIYLNQIKRKSDENFSNDKLKSSGFSCFMNQLIQVLNSCRLNNIKNELLNKFLNDVEISQ